MTKFEFDFKHIIGDKTMKSIGDKYGKDSFKYWEVTDVGSNRNVATFVGINGDESWYNVVIDNKGKEISKHYYSIFNTDDDCPYLVAYSLDGLQLAGIISKDTGEELSDFIFASVRDFESYEYQDDSSGGNFGWRAWCKLEDGRHTDVYWIYDQQIGTHEIFEPIKVSRKRF